MNRLLPRPARIRAIQTENPVTKTLVLDTGTRASPGQFIMLWLPRLDEKPFSLVNDDPLTIAVTRVGPFTQLVHELQVGDRLWWRGPFGRGFQMMGQRLLLVGGGCGAAPLVFLAYKAAGQGSQVTVVLGACTDRDLLFVDRFLSLGARVLVVTEDGSTGQTGVATDVVAQLLDWRTVDCIYGCGPEGMLNVLEELARRYDLPAQLSWEAYMRCGMGLCGSCDHRGRLVCWDGPVFRVE